MHVFTRLAALNTQPMNKGGRWFPAIPTGPPVRVRQLSAAAHHALAPCWLLASFYLQLLCQEGYKDKKQVNQGLTNAETCWVKNPTVLHQELFQI
jgi:hypothetical protein